jgi:probable selenium-dependent hydroxylase accessory protein YqeC
VLVPVLSAQAIGQPLSEKMAHRPDRIAALTGARLGEPLAPDHIIRLLIEADGLLKGAGDATVVPLINMVDDVEREALVREVATRALALSCRFDRVVLAAMRRDDPVVAIVTRQG